MDPWLTDQIKELLIRPCLSVSGYVGRRLNARLVTGQEIDERALTEDFVDRFDSSLPGNAWGAIPAELRDHQVFVSTSVRKSTLEHRTGADIGLVIQRSTTRPVQTHAEYACLVQCKRVDKHGAIRDFFHRVGSSTRRQSDLMLEITPSSFYFLFVPPSIVKHYSSLESLAFLEAAPGCSVPAWNLGLLEYADPVVPFAALPAHTKTEIAGILVVPALAVEAQQTPGASASLPAVLPNCVPFWYWFAQLFVPGFVGDRSEHTLNVARNVGGTDAAEGGYGVQFSLEVVISNG